MNLIQIGTRIKQCRKALKMTQERLAEQIDVSPHYIYEIERGSKAMSIHTLCKISSALNVSTDYLLSGHITASPLEDDTLTLLIENLSLQQRDRLADIISAILPHIK